jgi:hypothetical protein
VFIPTAFVLRGYATSPDNLFEAASVRYLAWIRRISRLKTKNLRRGPCNKASVALAPKTPPHLIAGGNKQEIIVGARFRSAAAGYIQARKTSAPCLRWSRGYPPCTLIAGVRVAA